MRTADGRDVTLQRVNLPADLSPFADVDYQALRLITERTECSNLKRSVMLRGLESKWKAGRLFKGREPTDHKWRMCEARMMLGDFTDWEGWQYRDPWSAGMWHNATTVVPDSKPWNGLPCKHLYVIGEQGVGDEVFFGQCLPVCLRIAEKVTFEGDPRLEKALYRMGVHEFIPSNYVMEGYIKKRTMLPIKAECWMPLGDMPRVFCSLKKADTGEQMMQPPFAAGYLTADPEQVKKYENYQGRVGLSWRGAQGHYKAREFVSLAGQKAISLQYDQSPLEQVERPDIDLKEDFEGLLGLLANLEKVITVSTTVAHLASAMGKNVEVILAPMNGRHRNLLPFRWGRGHGQPSSWYPSSRVFSGMSEYLAMNRKELNERSDEFSQAML